MAKQWTNWSGSLKFTPRQIVKPRSEVELQELVVEVARRGGTLRTAGKGHSSTPIVATDDTLVSLEDFTGVESVDREACEAWVRAGTSLQEMGDALLESGLAAHNLGDVNVQHIGGAVGTGTHGSGKNLGNLSTMVVGARMVTANGEVIERNIEEDPDFVRAAQVSLGVLGVFTSLRLKLLPRYKLHRQEWCTSVDACMAHLDELVEGNRNFDFYWFPRSDEIKLRTLNPPGEAPDLPYATLQKESVDWAPNIISRVREIRFEEMEYFLPAEVGPEIFLEVRRRVRAKHRKIVGWRVLYRTVAADKGMLSPCYERPTVTIATLQNNTLPYEEYFRDIEPLHQDHGGRPHWGKKHTMRASRLAGLYPQWESFHRLRRKLDPEGLFMTGYLRELLDTDEGGHR
ncbi:MAG: D-arabinono-1,4-lactone oxidase [Bradymonadaceae bacterium]